MEPLTLETFADLRDLTRDAGEHVQGRIGEYLTMLQPQLRPGAILGSYVAAKDSPKNAAIAFANFRTFFKEVAARAGFDPDIPEVIDVTSPKPVISPFEYRYALSAAGGERQVTVVVPVRFVLAYPEFPFAGLRDVVRVREPKSKLQDMALHFALLNFVIMQNRPLVQIFEDLRYSIRTERLEELGGIPLTTISSPAGSVRPPDAVIAQVLRFSGSNVIEEVIDTDEWAGLTGPLGDWYRIRRASGAAA
jgi:hypothetical protein